MKGRVVVCRETGKPFEIDEYDVPAVEPGAVLLRMAQAGICGSDLHVWRGETANRALPPNGRVMGHEGFGVVEELGEGVTGDSLGVPLSVGDRVIHSAVHPCYKCHMCLRGETNHCAARAYPEAGIHPYFTGTYCDYMYMRPRHPIFRVPDEVPDDVLAPVNCAMGTVTQGLISAGAGQGMSVVVQGAGGLGQMATAIAKDMGADQVIVLDRLENRLTLAEEFGADHTINIEEYNTPEARIDRVWELTRGRGADIVMELVGRAELLGEGIQMLSNGGTFIEIGNIVPGPTVAIDPSILLRGKRIIGSMMYQPHLIPRILDFVVRNLDRRPFEKMISHKYKLGDVNEVFPKAEWFQRETPVTRAVLVP